MIIAFTGHRPHKLGGYNNTTNMYWPIMREIDQRISLHNRDGHVEIISGMALGIDQWVAEYAIDRGIPLHAYVPFVGQERAWPESSQKFYQNLLGRATTVKVVCEGGYASWKMQARNEAMVEACDLLIAVWDGTPGGTKNCIDFALGYDRRIDYIRI